MEDKTIENTQTPEQQRNERLVAIHQTTMREFGDKIRSLTVAEFDKLNAAKDRQEKSAMVLAMIDALLFNAATFNEYSGGDRQTLMDTLGRFLDAFEQQQQTKLMFVPKEPYTD